MKVALVLLLAVMIPVVTIAQESAETPEIEKLFTKARIAEKEGRYQEALDAYRVVLDKWPDDQEFTPKAWVQMVSCLDKSGKKLAARGLAEKALNRYAGDEEFVKAIHGVLGASRVREERLKVPYSEKGLNHRMEYLRRTWKAQGIEEKEIEVRLERFKAAFEAQKAAREKIEEQKARLRKDGLEGEELERKIAELEAMAEQLLERKFRRRHERGMEGAREEFIRLAEHLGIPAEATERFLEEHRRGGPERGFRRGREFEEAIREQGEAIREAHERIERGERAIEHFERSLERSGEEAEHVVSRVHRQMEKLSDRVERLEEMMERAHEDLVPHLENLEKRLERLERKLEDDEDE